MSAALALIGTVRANGGQIRAEDGYLVVSPEAVAVPMLEELRLHKPEIIRILEEQQIAVAPWSMADVEPMAWAEDIAAWALERCASRENYEDSGGIGALLLDCAEWCIAHNTVPPTRAVLVELLRRAGFEIRDGLVSNLILKSDLLAVTETSATGNFHGGQQLQ
jgi:hypothetical protein